MVENAEVGDEMIEIIIKQLKDHLSKSQMKLQNSLSLYALKKMSFPL